MEKQSLLIVGRTGGSHIGGSLERAAKEMQLAAEFCDSDKAWRYGTFRQKFLWHLGGKRPVALNKFSRLILETCRRLQVKVVISTGMAPVTADALLECRKVGVSCVNFSTDDPFNPKMYAGWFLEALRQYDIVFTPRTSNLGELKRHGCRRVEYLPFGYDPKLFFPISGESCESDLFFAGTAEPNRAEYVSAAIRAGLSVRLYGRYWDCYGTTRAVAQGHADIPTLRKGVAGCKVALCLVRHDNRDGHSMRTFEVPAVGACMLVEDTDEHREIFGVEGANVMYCSTPSEMVSKAKLLLRDSPTRARLRDTVHQLITNGNNKYSDRLRKMLSTCDS